MSGEAIPKAARCFGIAITPRRQTTGSGKRNKKNEAKQTLDGEESHLFEMLRPVGVQLQLEDVGNVGGAHLTADEAHRRLALHPGGNVR